MAALTTNERVAKWRTNNPEKARAQSRLESANYRSRNAPTKTRYFIGIDGEGGGTDELGRQNYLLLHAAGGRIDRRLFHDNQRLTTAQCLDWILALPDDAIIVGYFFTYDVTQILRDLPNDRLSRVFGDRSDRGDHYTYWGRYAIEFVPRQYFRVALVRDNGRGLGVVKHSARTVNEVGGFFQKPFVEALRSWNIGSSEIIDEIASGKERRSEFTKMTDTELQYCRLECKMLAQLMTRFRDVCAETDAIPAQWRGAGSLAAALYRKHDAPTTKQLPRRPAKLEMMANAAYYGGRFEIARVGRIPGPVYEYDINSAYPAGMLKLPCPWHTKWKSFSANRTPIISRMEWPIFVDDIVFDNKAAPLCGFPIRDKGRLYWPQKGQGIYWSPEIFLANRNGAVIIESRGGYCAETKCDCHPYDWVRELYEYRKLLGKSERGYPLKLGINALYGKLAQRMGGAPYRDMIAAGLITAFCRAQLMDAYHGNADKIVMLATDGIFSTVPLDVNIGSGLGQWEYKLRESGLFVVQPGIYWSPGSDQLPRTRGIPRSRIIERRNDFEQTFDRWCRGDGNDEAPTVAVTVPTFIAHRLALSRGKPEIAGAWLPNDKIPECSGDKAPPWCHSLKWISFDWGNKRTLVGRVENGAVFTAPYEGNFALRSETYDPALLTDLAERILDQEGMPDWEPWGNSDE